jgi:hypothetical protein
LLLDLTPQALTNESFLLYVIITVVSFIILWAIVSIPVWISARVLSAKQGKFSRAMLVTLAGPLTYMIVYFISTRLLTILLSLGNKYYYSLSSVNMIGIVLALVGWIYVFKKGFATGWIRALCIAIVAVIVFVIMGIAIALILDQLLPHTSHTIFPPIPFQQI